MALAPDTGDDDLHAGQVVWEAQLSEGEAGISWEWAEIRSGLVVMSDPMTIVSNLVLLDLGNECLGQRQQLLSIHRAIHGCKWEASVRIALGRFRRGPNVSDRAPDVACDSLRLHAA